MANLTENAVWHDAIYQIERNDPVSGGKNGIVNLPHKDLADRTQYLKENLETLASQVLQGFLLVNSFETGATLTLSNEVLLWNADKQYYKWAGDLPKIVAPNSTPQTTGGIGAGRWLLVGDASLREQLASTHGASIVKTESGATVESQINHLGDVSKSLSQLTAGIDFFRRNKTQQLIQKARKIEIIAHRGFFGGILTPFYTENTLMAFAKAIELGADGIEIDVSVTIDGVIRVMHDLELGRTTTGTGKITEVTSEYLDSIKIKALVGTMYENIVKIPYLSSVLDLIRSTGKHLVLELKNLRNIDDVDLCVQAVIDAGCVDLTTFISFDFEWIIRALDYSPDVSAAIIQADGQDYMQRFNKIATYNGRGGISPSVSVAAGWPWLPQWCKERNVPLFCWTVSDYTTLDKMIGLGYSRFTTDYQFLRGF